MCTYHACSSDDDTIGVLLTDEEETAIESVEELPTNISTGKVEETGAAIGKLGSAAAELEVGI